MARTQVFTDIGAFADAVRPLVDADPAGSAMLGRMLATELATPSPGIPLMATVADGRRVRVAAMGTSRLPLTVVCDVDDRDTADVGADDAHPDPARPDPTAALMHALVTRFLAESLPVERISGPVTAAESLARTWSSFTGVPVGRDMTLLLYRLGTLVEPGGGAGTARAAAADDPADAELIAAWWFEFSREAGIGPPGGDPDPWALREDARRGRVVIILSDHDRPVAAAGHSSVVTGRARIAPVYTPSQHRRRGYGAAVTAAAVRSAQRCGATEITLFADADYPAANLLYRGLGFDVVAEYAEFAVSPTSPSGSGTG
jgi:ribosomal protein S18 acetylase RimI-like enzyme